MTRNRDYWCAVAEARSRWIAALPEMQDIEELLAGGGSTLMAGPSAADGSTGEADLLGDVRGRRLLHLGCGPGYDSVSWANLGALVTAVDFVEENVRECRRLASVALAATASSSNSATGDATGTIGQADRGTPRAENTIQAIAADCVKLPFRSATFDAVYAAGLVAWLGDLTALYREIARVLVPDGRLLAVEEHPLAMILSDDGVPVPSSHPYRDQALHNRVDATALPWPMPHGELETDDYLWTTGTLVTRIIEAGLQIEKLLEPFWSHPPACHAHASVGMAFLPTCLVLLARRPHGDG